MISTQTYSSALTISVKASEDIPKYRFINYYGNLCALGERALGVSSLSASKDNQVTTETLGTMLVETNGAIAKGSALSSTADGKAKIAETTETINAYALSSCSAAGIIKIRLVI